MRLVKAKENVNLKDIEGKTNYERIVVKPNKLNKKHPFDCGKASCFLCHYEKILRKKKVRDRKLDEAAKQQLKEDL